MTIDSSIKSATLNCIYHDNHKGSNFEKNVPKTKYLKIN